MAEQVKLTWKPVATKQFTGDRAKLFTAYEEAKAMMVASRDELEESVTKGLVKMDAVPDGKECVYGYRFGQMAVAFAEPKANKTPKDAIVL